MKAVCVGSLTCDYFVKTTNLTNSNLCLTKGLKTTVDSIFTYTGGSAANAGATFARFGFETRVLGVVGNDMQADLLKSDLLKDQINLSLIRRFEGRTAQSIIFSFSDGERSILTDRGIQNKLDLTAGIAPSCDVLYIGPLSLQSHQGLTSFIQQTRAPLVAINPSMEQIKQAPESLFECFKQAHIVIMNEVESQELARQLKLTGSCTQAIDWTRYLASTDQQQDTIVVITQGAQGASLSQSGTFTYFQPSLATSVLDTTGAGDAFGAAFTAALAQNYALESAAFIAAHNSAAVIQKVGGHEGALTTEQLHQLCQQ